MKPILHIAVEVAHRRACVGANEPVKLAGSTSLPELTTNIDAATLYTVDIGETT